MSFYADAKDYLRPEFLEYYQNTCDLFDDQIERLHISKHILYKIKEYLIKEILFSRNNVAIQLVYQNFIDICFLIISRLLSDNTSDLISLNQFKNEVVQNIRSPAQKKEYQNYLKLIITPKKVEDNRLKVKNIRDSMIAHYKKSYFVDYLKVESITWSELDELVDYIKIYFQSLLFKSSYITMNTIAYHDNIISSNQQRADIDFIIEKYEDESPIIINLEQYPINWDFIKDDYTDEQIQYIKKILERRKKI
jgi:hypothetical protein